MTPSTRYTVGAVLISSLSIAWPGGQGRSGAERPQEPIVPPVITVPAGAAAVEQTAQGAPPAAIVAERFGGLGAGFEGPQGTAAVRNPSDNSLAVGPDHI